MKPSSLRMRAISNFTLEAGTSTFWCFAAYAFRMRVSISAIGSVITSPVNMSARKLRSLLHAGAGLALPARLRHSRYVTLEGQIAEADAAQRKASKIAAAPSAALASVVNSSGKHVQFDSGCLRPLDRLLARRALLLLDPPLGVIKRSLQLVGFVH